MTTTVLVAAGALLCANGLLRPERFVVWTAAAPLLAAMWFVLSRVEARCAGGTATGAERRLTREAILGAGTVLIASLVVALLETLQIEGSAAARVVGLLSGAALLGIGNAFPKALPRWAGQPARSARVEARQRFAGWTFVLAGLGIIGAWSVLPTAAAIRTTLGLGFTAVALGTARVCMTRIPRRTAS